MVAEGLVVATTLAGVVLWGSIPGVTVLATEVPTSTAFIDLRRAEAAARGERLDIQLRWRPLARISRYLRAAVVYAEDDRFYEHEGVDWTAIEKALDTNWTRGAMAVGGSTITQQLAKNLYLSPSRSLVRKLRELLIAHRLEDHLTKERILELYLNVVEWGPGVFGAEAAAQHWFGHAAAALTPAEAARLATALPNPFTRSPRVRTPALTRKAARLIRRMRREHLIGSAEERTALEAVGAAAPR